MENVYRIGFDSRSAEKRARAFRKELTLTDKASKKLDIQTRVLGKGLTKLGAIASGAAIAAGFAAITRNAAELQSINRRIARSTNEVAEVNQFLAKTSNDLSVSYKAVKDSFSRLLPLQKGGLVTMRQIKDVTIGLANASAALGVSQQDAALSMRGLIQAMGSGQRVKAEEFNQVFEAIPAVLLAVEQQAGLTAGSFRRMVVAGDITASEFVKKYIGGLKDFAGAAEDARDAINQSFTRIGSQYDILSEKLIQPLNASIVPFANAVEKSLKHIADNTDDYVSAIKTVAIATGLAFGLNSISKIKKYAATAIATQDAIKKSTIEKTAADATAAQQATFEELKAKRRIIIQRETLVVKSQATIATNENTAAETANAAALAKSAQAEASRLVISREQAALSSATNAARKKNFADLATSEAAEIKSRAAATKAIQAQTVAQNNLQVSRQKAKVQAGLLVTAQVNENHAANANAVAVKSQFVAQQALNKSKTAGIAITSGSTVAQIKSAASISAANVAMRGSTLAALAGAKAMDIFKASVAFVGGPIGVAIIAAYAVYQFRDALNTQNGATHETVASLADLAEGYDATGDAAKDAGEKVIAAAKAELAQNKALLLSLKANVPEGSHRDGTSVQKDQYYNTIRDLNEGVAELEKSIKSAEDGFKEASARAAKEATQGAIDASKAALEAAALDIIDDVLDDKKIQELKDKIANLPKLEKAGLISDDQSKRASALLKEQLADLDGTSDAMKLAEERADDLADAMANYSDIAGAFDPSVALQNDFLDSTNDLEEAQRLGAITAGQYAIQMGKLGDEHDNDQIDLRIEKERALRDILSGDTDFSELDSYNDSLLMLNRQLDKTPEKAQQIKLAIAALGQEFINQFDEVDDIGKLEDKYDQQIEALRRFGNEHIELKQQISSQILDIELNRMDAVEAAEEKAKRKQLDLEKKKGDQFESYLGQQLSSAGKHNKALFEADKAWRASQAAAAAYEMYQNAAVWGAKYGGAAGAFAAQAAVVGLATANIRGILRQKFGGASTSSPSKGGGSGHTSSSSTQTTSAAQQAPANVTVNVIQADELIDRNKLSKIVNSGLAASSSTKDILIDPNTLRIRVNGEAP